MRGLWTFLLGAAIGLMGTVLVLELDSPFDRGSQAPATNIGNARVGFDQDTLATVVNRFLTEGVTPIRYLVSNARVRDDGHIELTLAAPPGSPSGSGGALLLDPGIVDGKLVMEVIEVEAEEGESAEEVAQILQAVLETRLAVLAGEADYDLVAIITTDGRLTLEISI